MARNLTPADSPPWHFIQFCFAIIKAVIRRRRLQGLSYTEEKNHTGVRLSSVIRFVTDLRTLAAATWYFPGRRGYGILIRMKKMLAGLAFACLILAQGTVDTVTIGKIRSEALEHSQIMHTLHMLTDRYGPRVTGTPNHEADAAGVIGQFKEWGMTNAHREGWDFGHPGWLNERASAFLVAPVKENLKFEVLAWTPSTSGTITGSVVELGDLP